MERAKSVREVLNLTKFGFFFFNDTATTEIYTLSLHDALPISTNRPATPSNPPRWFMKPGCGSSRSEEHTSELQSRVDLVCRLLLEKNKNQINWPSLIIKNNESHPVSSYVN